MGCVALNAALNDTARKPWPGKEDGFAGYDSMAMATT